MSNSIVQIEGLKKSFGSVVALDDISFEVEQGKVVIDTTRPTATILPVSNE